MKRRSDLGQLGIMGISELQAAMELLPVHQSQGTKRHDLARQGRFGTLGAIVAQRAERPQGLGWWRILGSPKSVKGRVRSVAAKNYRIP